MDAFARWLREGGDAFSLERDLRGMRPDRAGLRLMPLVPYSCANCGHWQRYFAPPPDCPVCTDTRNDLPEDGWRFLTVEEVRGMLRGHWRRLDRDMVAFSTSPPHGLNGTGLAAAAPRGQHRLRGRALLHRRDAGGDPALGGIRFLASSHVHGYRRALAAAGRLPAGGAGDPKGRSAADERPSA
jgi:hypothetical protein